MEILHSRFSAALDSRSPRELLSSAPSLRLQMGGEEKIYLADHRQPNGVYIQNALDRALALCQALCPTLLRIDPEDPEELSPRVLSMLGLSAPREVLREGGSCQLYWEAPGDLRKLLREIIRSEISPGGLEVLCGSVFLLREQSPVLLCLRDDRWADLAAPDPGALRPFAARFSCWIPGEKV